MEALLIVYLLDVCRHFRRLLEWVVFHDGVGVVVEDFTLFKRSEYFSYRGNRLLSVLRFPLLKAAHIGVFVGHGVGPVRLKSARITLIRSEKQDRVRLSHCR